MSHRLRSPYATTQIPHDILLSIYALSRQNHSVAQTCGITLNDPLDVPHCHGSQGCFRLNGEFLGTIALSTADRTLSDPRHLFNGIEDCSVVNQNDVRRTKTTMANVKQIQQSKDKLFEHGQRVRSDHTSILS
jgi:hypothetical protein